MSNFVIECPVCHRYSRSDTGFLIPGIRCDCGHVIRMRPDEMAVRTCGGCGYSVLFDRRQGERGLCPVCRQNLYVTAAPQALVHFPCPSCGVDMQADRSQTSATCPVCLGCIDVQQRVEWLETHPDEMPDAICCSLKDILIWKHPRTTFPLGAQLFVREGQEAVLLLNNDGPTSFAPGWHTLDSGVRSRVGSMYQLGSNSIHAEVYFVNCATLMGIKWGTPQKFSLCDPGSGTHVELGAAGNFHARVTDAKRLLEHLAGTGDTLTPEKLFAVRTGRLWTMIVSHIRSLMPRIITENHISLLGLDAQLTHISALMRAALNTELEAYGLQLPEFYINSINRPDDNSMNRHKTPLRPLPSSPRHDRWTCACGLTGIAGNSCPRCGRERY